MDYIVLSVLSGVDVARVGIVAGNPGVFWGYPYPYPRKPVPLSGGTGFGGWGQGFQGV